MATEHAVEWERIARSLAGPLGWSALPWSEVDVSATPTALATPMPIADMAVAVQALVGLAAAALHSARGGVNQRVGIDRFEASLSTTPAAYLRIDGQRAGDWDPLTGYFAASDGWVYLHTAFPHLRHGLLAEFNLPEDKSAVSAGLALLPAQEIEDRAARSGVCAIKLRSRAEWTAHPQSEALRSVPVVGLNRVSDAPPRPMTVGDAPLSDVRVLDLSRVIAGPTMGRVLAEHGADVLRIGADGLPSLPELVIETGHGKRAAHLDLKTDAGRAGLLGLVREADILIDGFRPGALAALGLGSTDLQIVRPDLIHIDLSAFGGEGPWGGRRGYDTYVQAATGLAQMTNDGPVRLPCQPLDYFSGYLGAAAAMVAVRRRMIEGGGWRSQLALARTAMWIWDQSDCLPDEAEPPKSNPADPAELRWEVDSAFGRVSSLRPAVRLSETPAKWRLPPVALGTHDPVWAG